MTQKQKTIRAINKISKLSTVLTGIVLVVLLTIPFTAQSQQSSYITVSIEDEFSFTDIPDNVYLNSYITSYSGRGPKSQSGSTMDSTSYLIVKDKRNCGGFNLQISSTTTDPLTIRVISSTLLSPALSGTTAGNIVYLTGFDGTPDAGSVQNAVAPLNSTCSDFDSTSTYLIGGCVSNSNVLPTTLDLIQGNLTAPAGRDGEMGFGVAFYTWIPKLTAPGEYIDTLTYTLSDDTTGTCT